MGVAVSEERFDRIERRLDGVAADVAVLQTDVAVLKSDVAVLKVDVSELKTDVSELKTDVWELKAKVADNTTGIADLRRHMGVLHEEVLDRFRALAEDDSLRREMRAGFAELRQLLKDLTVVGDAADRRFAATLDDHEDRIRRLEGR
jgi:chromosome segregation ATPase